MKNAVDYCEMIEAKDISHKKLEVNFPVVDDRSKLLSLRDVGFKLIYEPSIMKNHKYLIRDSLIEKIQRISGKLSNQNKTLVIRSAWRSFAHQRLLWERNWNAMKKKFPEKTDDEVSETTSYFIAPPTKSTHTTGGALDALIYDDKTSKILDFGSNNGLKIQLDKKCYPHHPDISAVAKENRKLLLGLFHEEDFVCDLKEFWHFDYGNIGWAIEKAHDFAFYGIIENTNSPE